MIVYGSKATLLKSEFISEPCPNCNNNNSIQMSVYQRYAHIFWIPFFPIGKMGVSACSNCRQVLKDKNMPASLKLSYQNLKSQTRTPVWNFAGLGIVAVIAVSVMVNDNQTKKKVSRLILTPKPGDVLHVKEKDTSYTLYKLTRVTKDSVYLVLCKYESDQENDLDNLEAKGFDTVENALSRSDFVEMNTNEKILDIDRK
jgi:hypothetical protein